MRKQAVAPIALLLLASCKDHDQVTGPQSFPGITVSYTSWSICGRHSPDPNPDYTNPAIRAQVAQSQSRFSIRIPEVGLITGDLAPFTPGSMTYAWSLTLDPPCSGTVSGTNTTSGNEMVFTFPASDAWRCASCSDSSGGVIRLFTPPQPI